ncbi:Porin [Candidatus Electronema halotolerans]
MKKVLVAGAALMLAGATAADAGVNLSGDARATYVGKQDYQRNIDQDSADGYHDYIESRIGLNIDGKTSKEGMFVKARVYFDGYGFEDDAPWNGTENQQVTVDYAYMQIPLGPNWAIKAGRVNPDFSKFYSWNIRPTRVYAMYQNGNFAFKPFLGVKQEETSTDTDNWDDNDFMEYGFVASLKLLTGWTVKAYGRYDDDQREWDKSADEVYRVTGDVASGFKVTESYPTTSHKDKSGFTGDLVLTNDGAACPIGFTAELAYKAADLQGTEDDGIGSYVMLSKRMTDRFTPAILAGMTKDGYVADNDFGFVMVGGDTSSQVMRVGDGGDLLFGAFVANYAASERLTLTGNLLYADFDNDEAGAFDNAIEVSGVASYALSDSASLTYKAGYLAPSVIDGGGVAEDAYFGHLLRLNLAF